MPPPTNRRNWGATSPTRSKDGAFTDIETLAFFAGKRVVVRSTNVKAVQWDEERSELTVEFLNGMVYRYGGFDRVMGARLVRSQSQGGFLHDALISQGNRGTRV